MKLDYTASDLTRRIGLLKRTLTKDRAANRLETYTRLKTVWAYVEVRSAANANVEQLQHGVVRYFVVIRWDKSLFGSIDAIEYDGRFLRLVSPCYRGGNRFIVINARELDLEETVPEVR